MPFIFYDENVAELKKYFGKYVAGAAWNDPAVLGAPLQGGPNVDIHTEQGIRDTITSNASKYATTTGVTGGDNFLKIIRDAAAGNSPDLTVYVLKGVHQPGKEHLSVGLMGKIYHLNVKRTGDASKFSIRSMSEGDRLYDDPEWKTA